MDRKEIQDQLNLLNWAADVFKAAQEWPRCGENWPMGQIEEDAEKVFEASGVRPNCLGDISVKELRAAGQHELADYEEERIDRMRREIFGDEIAEKMKNRKQ